jgi:hypothetical protein
VEAAYPYGYHIAYDPVSTISSIFTWDLNTATPSTPPANVDSTIVGLQGWGNVIKDVGLAGDQLYISQNGSFCAYQVDSGTPAYLSALDPEDFPFGIRWIGVDDSAICIGNDTKAYLYPRQCSITPATDAPVIAAGGRSLLSVRPNPASGPTDVVFTPARAGVVQLDVFDVAGRRVAQLVNGRFEGRSVVRWNGTAHDGAPVPAGVYFVRLNTRDGSATEKLVLVR